MRGTRRVRRVALTAMFGMACLAVPMSSAHAEPQSEEAQFIALINALRVSKGLVALAPDGRLTEVARAWSAVMAQAGSISHNPNFAAQMGDGWRKLGENVGVGASVDWLEQAFEKSPHHYENLVDPDFRMIGVGIVDTADGSIWVTEDFEQARSATSLPSAVRPAPNTRPAPAPKPAPAPRPAPVPGAAGAQSAAGRVTQRSSPPPAAAPVVPTTAPEAPVTPSSVLPPVVEGTKTARPARTGQGNDVLASSLARSQHPMRSGFVLACMLAIALGLALALVLRARRRRARA